MAYQSQHQTLLGVGSDRAEDLFCDSLIGNTERTELELRRAALHPSASLKDETVRQVRAAALGMSQYEYEQRLLDMGVDY